MNAKKPAESAAPAKPETYGEWIKKRKSIFYISNAKAFDLLRRRIEDKLVDGITTQELQATVSAFSQLVHAEAKWLDTFD